MQQPRDGEDFLAVLKRLLPAESAKRLSTQSLTQLAAYSELLERWSPRVDLIAPTSREMLVSRHILDSLFAWEIVSREFSLPASRSVVDVGSGAGLPGIVIAIATPTLPVVLCEPREKRFLFLEEARRQLGISNIYPVRSRLETLPAEDSRSPALLITRATGIDELMMSERKKFDSAVAIMTTPQSKNSLNTGEFFDYELPPDGAKRVLTLLR